MKALARAPAPVFVTALLATILVVYLPHVGHGFLRDDFAWVADSQVAGVSDLVRLFTDAPVFYRPLVSLSFAANR